LGRSGEVVSVKSGYARNFLFPQKFAVYADKNTLRMQAKLQEKRAVKAVEDKKASEELAKVLDGKVLTIHVKVDPENHMYGSVGHTDIIHLFEKEGYKIEKSAVVLKHPIKELGVHELVLKLKEGVIASYVLKVIAEGAKIVEEEVDLKVEKIEEKQ
jgi:large subunit ribosomal protein L9